MLGARRAPVTSDAASPGMAASALRRCGCKRAAAAPHLSCSSSAAMLVCEACSSCSRSKCRLETMWVAAYLLIWALAGCSCAGVMQQLLPPLPLLPPHACAAMHARAYGSARNSQLLTGETGQGRQGRWSRQAAAPARESSTQRSAEAGTRRARGAAAATKERCNSCNRRAQAGATREGSQDRGRDSSTRPTRAPTQRATEEPTQHSQDGR